MPCIVKTILELVHSDFGAAHAAEIMLASTDFFGAVVFTGNELHCRDEEEFGAMLSDAVARNDTFLAAACVNEAQLLVIVRAGLKVDSALHVGSFVTRGRDGEEIFVRYSLAVHGNLHCQALTIEANNHASITGDINASLVQINGTDGASLHCQGIARATYFVHDKPVEPIHFESPPIECKSYEIDAKLIVSNRMSDSVRVLEEQDEIAAFLTNLQSEAQHSPKGTRSPADDAFWQLQDFDFERIIVFTQDIHLEKQDSLFSMVWLSSQGIEVENRLRTLVVVDGNIVAEGNVTLSEDYCIVRGDIECTSLYVDGEAFFVCFGTCKARYIHSTYNGVVSSIQCAETDFFLKSHDEMLGIIDLNSGAAVLQEGNYEVEVMESTFVEGVLEDGWLTQEGLERIENGESVLRWDCNEILRQVARLPTETEDAVAALARTKGVAEFRFWERPSAYNKQRPRGTVLHALAQIEASTASMRRWIQTLVQAGVPLHTMSHGADYYNRDDGPGNGLQLAVVDGNIETAQAFAEEGLDINATVGTLDLAKMLTANPKTGRATLDLLAEFGVPGFSEAQRKLDKVEPVQNESSD